MVHITHPTAVASLLVVCLLLPLKAFTPPLPSSCSFSDDPRVSQQAEIEAVHITQLRACIAEMRSNWYSLPTAWSPPHIVPDETTIHANDIIQLRSNLDDVYDRAGRRRPTYRKPIDRSSVPASDITEIRQAIAALEGPFTTQTIDLNGGGGNWGLDRIDQVSGTDGSYHYTGTGAGVNIYVIDTGVRSGHRDFLDSSGNSSRVHSVGDFCQGGPQPRTNSAETYDDGFDGHGTHDASYAAGRLSGVAKNAVIWSLRAQGSDGPACGENANAAAMKAAVDWINQHATPPAVVNISMELGGADACDPAGGGDGVCALLSSIRMSIGKGYVYTLSGGTGGSTESHWGYLTRLALVVGGTKRGSDQLDYPLNQKGTYGGNLALFAPAAGLYGAGRGSDTSYTVPETPPALPAGDSFAAPFVAGAAAVYLERYPTATPHQVRSALLAAATPGTVVNPGRGTPNRLLRVPQ